MSHEQDHREIRGFLDQWKGIYSALRVIALLLGILVSLVTLFVLTQGAG